MLRVDVESHVTAVDGEAVDAGKVSEGTGRALRLGGDRREREMPQLVERAALLRAAGADDAHSVAQRLDLGEDMAREQDGSPLRLDLADAVLEDRLHEGVEP